MPESGITLPPDGTGKTTRTVTNTTTAGTVHSHVQVIGDANSTNTATVDSSGRLRVVNAEDIGRLPVTMAVIAQAGVTTEALLSTAQNKGGVSASATLYTVTSGKTFRISQISLVARSTTTAAVWARAVLRSNFTSAAVTTTSPVVWVAEVSSNGAVAGYTGNITATFSDGLEFPSGAVLGFSYVASATSALVTLSVTGYEY